MDSYNVAETRPAEQKDYAAIRGITLTAFTLVGWPYRLEKRFGLREFGVQEKAKWVDNYLQAGPADCIVAVDGDQLVGFAVPRLLVPGWLGELYYIAIHESFRGRGYGRLLVEATVEHFRSLEARAVAISFDHDNVPAARLYTSCGFSFLRQLSLYVREMPDGDSASDLPSAARVPNSKILPVGRTLPSKLASGFFSSTKELTPGACVARAYGWNFAGVEDFSASLAEDLSTATSGAISVGDQGVLGILTWRLNEAAAVAELRPLRGIDFDTCLALLIRTMDVLREQRVRVAYCWIPDEDLNSRIALQQLGFQWFHAATWVSREVGSVRIT